jgi:amphi-Trp domain-containing protein
MKMAKEKESDFRHESLQDSVSIEKYLEALNGGFSSGQLKFSNEDGEIVLKPNGLVNFEVRASRRNDRAKLTLKFSWKDGEGRERNGNGRLHINGESQAADR